MNILTNFYSFFPIYFSTEAHLKGLESSADIFNALSDLPGDIDDVECLFKVNK